MVGSGGRGGRRRNRSRRGIDPARQREDLGRVGGGVLGDGEAAVRRNLKSRGSFDHGPGRGVGALGGQLLFQAEVVDNVLRSEERRVGKEWRSRWAPDQ